MVISQIPVATTTNLEWGWMLCFHKYNIHFYSFFTFVQFSFSLAVGFVIAALPLSSLSLSRLQLTPPRTAFLQRP